MPRYVYFTHTLRGATPEATERNRRAASGLVAAIVAYHRGDIIPVAPWLHLAEVWSEADGRALGLQIDCAAIERCDELWHIGPVGLLSEGRLIEEEHAHKCGKPVHDMRGKY